MKKVVLTCLIFCIVALINGRSGNSSVTSVPPLGIGGSSHFNEKCISHQLRNSDSEFTGSQEFDKLINSFLIRHGIKGASVAVASAGRLVYAKGYGIADIEKNEPMEPYHILRIASVSKLLTATAIMKLVDQGKISLDQKVFGQDGLLNDSAYCCYHDKKYEKITIRHLLTHTAGWNRRNGDPVFQHFTIAKKFNEALPVDIKTTICYALHYPLSYRPGTHYSYSNLGYVILGEIIGKISGNPYEVYVQTEILTPLGIYDMHIGHSFYSESFWNESRYYESRYAQSCIAYDGSECSVPRIYGGNNMALLGAAGGWVASPSELLRFILAIDGRDDFPDIISRKAYKAMTTPDPSTSGLLGWGGKDKHDNLWRTGSFAGTNALILKREDGLTWVVILNTSCSKQKSIPYTIMRTMSEALKKIQDWPEYDLFSFKKLDFTQPISTNFIN